VGSRVTGQAEAADGNKQDGRDDSAGVRMPRKKKGHKEETKTGRSKKQNVKKLSHFNFLWVRVAPGRGAGYPRPKPSQP